MITCTGYILNYLKQCYNSIIKYNHVIVIRNRTNKESNFDDKTNGIVNDDDSHVRHGLLYNLIKHYKKEHFINIIFLYIILELIYSVFVSVSGDLYSLKTPSYGFCSMTIEYIPQTLMVILFNCVFLPLVLYELHCMEVALSMKNSLIVAIICMMIGSIGYISALLTPAYGCSVIVRYIPSDSFVLLICCSFNYTQITKPLLDLYHMNNGAKKLEATKKGLLQLLNDNQLFTEFFEDCKKKRCVENALFHLDYTKFRNYFISHTKNFNIQNSTNNSNNRSLNLSQHDNSSSTSKTTKINIGDQHPEIFELQKKKYNIYNNQTDSMSDVSSVLTKEAHHKQSSIIDSNLSDEMLSKEKEKENKKIIAFQDELHIMINDIYFRYFNINSEYQLNLPNKVVKKVTERIDYYNEFYRYREEDADEFFSESLSMGDVFNESYAEIIDSLYLNVYTGYLIAKKKNNSK